MRVRGRPDKPGRPRLAVGDALAQVIAASGPLSYFSSLLDMPACHRGRISLPSWQIVKSLTDRDAAS
ncbi:hypothetical protein MPLA_1360023 [Mesorhizobium sp. ORS 3359]|nr:hypothetical protein MPLA_1360023 [Mesorhizobium sp. ORS 3359]